MPSSVVLPSSSLSSSSPPNPTPTNPDELLRRCTELSFLLYHALRLDPNQGAQGHGLEVTIVSYLKKYTSNSAVERALKGREAVDTDGKGEPSFHDASTTSLLYSLESSLAETLALTSGFRPLDTSKLDDGGSSPTTAEDVRAQQALDSERRSELHILQKKIVEQQDSLQLSLTTLLTSLSHLLSTFPPLLNTHHLLTTLPSTTSNLSLLLLKLSSLLPLRSRTNLSLSHPRLDASLFSLGEALERRIKRAQKEGENLEEEGRGWREALGGGEKGKGKGKGEKRFEELMREMEGIEREGGQVERDLRRLGVGAGGGAR